MQVNFGVGHESGPFMNGVRSTDQKCYLNTTIYNINWVTITAGIPNTDSSSDIKHQIRSVVIRVYNLIQIGQHIQLIII